MSEYDIIVGIDIGIRNFSLCAILRQTKSILIWDTFDLSEKKFHDLIVHLNQVLHQCMSYFPDPMHSSCLWVVEQQPNKGPSRHFALCGAISMFVASCFNHALVYKQPPSKAFGKMKKKYSERKKMSIEECESRIDSYFIPVDMLNKFRTLTKRDDMAESFLLATNVFY